MGGNRHAGRSPAAHTGCTAHRLGQKFIAAQLLRKRGAGPTILISPLLSLMRNQIDAAHKLGLRAASINSANDLEDNAQVEASLLADDIDLLLISPERLANQHFRENVWELYTGRGRSTLCLRLGPRLSPKLSLNHAHSE